MHKLCVGQTLEQSNNSFQGRFVMRAFDQTLARLKNILMTALVLVMTVALAQPAHATWGSRDATFDLKLSLNADRSDAIAMNGAGTRLDGEVAIFLETSLDQRYIRAVNFYINGERVNRESRAPFDLGSTQRNGLANLVETEEAFDLGPQTVKAVVQRWFAYPMVIEGTLNVLPAEPTIVETAISNPDFSILVEALIAADLVEAVNRPGPC
jgi:hypothetical protein